MSHKLLFLLLCCFGFSLASNDLIAHWSFDSTSEGIYFDVTGNGFDAAIQKGSTSITEGVKINGLNCTSDSFLVSAYNSDSAFNFPEFTIEGWIYSYVDLVNPGSFFNSHHILTTQTWIPSGLAEGYEISIDDRGHLHLAMANSKGSSWIICTSDSILKPRIWYHVAGTYDGTTMKVYINGRLAGSLSNSSGYNHSHAKAVIGCQMPADSSQWRNWFIGKIDELKLYNYALNAQELLNSYNELKPPEEPPFEINFGLKTAYAQPGDTVVMPIYITNFEDYAINACQFTMKFDSKIVELLSIEKDSGIVKDWPLFVWNPIKTDSISIAVAGTSTPVNYGEGEFVRCIFLVKSDAKNNDTCTIKLNNISIDETYHLITATSVNGKIIINNTDILYGDVTGNKEVNIFDAQQVLSYVVGALSLPEPVCCPNFTVAVADVSGNGTITSYDAALIFQYSVGLLPEFPVTRASQKKLSKSFGAPSPKVAKISMTIENFSGSELRCNIVGSNLKGFVAGEFFIRYNPLVVNPTKGLISTAVRGASLNSKMDPDSRLLKIALVTNDDIDANDTITLVNITLPPSTGDPSSAFSISTVLINEGKIVTNINNETVGGGLIQPVFENFGPILNVLGRNVTIHTHNGEPLEIRVWALNGRSVVFKKYNAISGSHTLNLNLLSKGVYLYQIRNGAKLLKGRFLITK